MLRIVRSAHRHGITDDDIRHALANPIRVIDDEEDITLIVGGDRGGRLIEVGLAARDDETVVFHAMPARRKFLR